MSPGSAVLGVLAGALIDPLRRQLSYLVVESRGWLRTRQYLVPLGTTCFDPNRRELHVDVEAHDLRDTRAKRFLRYSDDDVIAAMFAPRAA